MDNRWDDDAAAACASELELRAYTSRLLGGDASLVLLGGGNTSLKLADADGEPVLYVKGTGVDLAHASASDFTPLRLAPVRAMLHKAELGYAAMMRELAEYALTPSAPRPSIETLLHAAIPARYVEHTHADSVLAVTNTDAGAALAEEVFGDLALVVPYRHSGFALAKICAEAWNAGATGTTIGIVLMHHGVVACGDTARASYESMLRLVGRAEDYLAEQGAKAPPELTAPALDHAAAVELARLRRDLSRVAGYPLLLGRCEDRVMTAFSKLPAAAELAAQSPATPQHAVFARRLPMLGRDLDAFAARYAEYLRLLPDGEQRLDAAPRIVLDPVLGTLAAGISPWHMNAAAASYRHTVETMLRANVHHRYQGLPPRAVLEAELEYGGTERRIAGARAEDVALAGTVTLLAPSLGTLQADLANAVLAAGGAAITVRAPGAALFTPRETMGHLQVTDPAQAGIKAVERFGGIDTLVCAVTDQDSIGQFLPWLLLSPAQARVVLVQTSGGPAGSKAQCDRLRAHGVAVSEIDAAHFAGAAELGAAVVRASAVPVTLCFPKLR